MGTSQELYKKAKQIIPGGTQLLSKRSEMFLPDKWPAYYQKALGAEIWDLDGHHYYDMSYMGIGSCLLGYADPDVNERVIKAIDQGSMTTLNCSEEVELAELLCQLHPWAHMVRYARTGGEAMAISARIARARTRKDVILFCGYHGWHDWYLSANLNDPEALNEHLLAGLQANGVPRGLQATALPFRYNDLEDFYAQLKRCSDGVAAVIMEPLRNFRPAKGFLQAIREETSKRNIILIFDEITSGWRLNSGGAHMTLKIQPDIAVFGKGMSNGYPMAAVIGTRDVMEAAQDAFISSTYWTERVGPTAALATIRKLMECNVPHHLIHAGSRVQQGWRSLAQKHGILINVTGIEPLGSFSFNYNKKELLLKTLFTQFMLEKGYLAGTAFYASFAHTDKIIDGYLRNVDEAFAFIAEALDKDDLEGQLKGPVCHAGFQRLN